MLPKKITRYVLWELTKVFVVSSVGFIALMLVVGVVDEAAERGLGPELILRIIPFILPKALMFAMPATCLLSVCVVFGRMAAENEIIALKSLGLHQSVVVIPTLAAAFLLSLFAVWVNDISFAWSHWGVEKVVLESSDKIVYSVLKNEGSFRSDNFSIEVQGVEDRRLIQPAISFRNGTDNIRLVAHEAMIEADPKSHSLVFTLVRGSAKSEKEQIHVKFDNQMEQKVQLMSPEDIAKATGDPSHLYLSQIKGEIVKQEVDLEERKLDQAVRASSQLMSGDLLGLTGSKWDERHENFDDAVARLGRLRVVPHRRWANGFSCLAFAVIGIPMAIRLRTSNYATTFGICFLPILLLYYPLFMYGLGGAKAGTLPPYGAWLGNLACLALGVVLMYREFKR